MGRESYSRYLSRLRTEAWMREWMDRPRQRALDRFADRIIEL
jgi:hypothetical protein